MLLVRALASLLTQAVSPPACAACDALLDRRVAFCKACVATVTRARGHGTSGATAFAAYGGAVAIALRRFKYEDRPDLAAPLGSLAQRAAQRLPRSRIDVVVPVPLHPRRLAERGYNQAALLAQPVARDLGATLVARALRRSRNTPQQARLERDERLSNVAGAFEVADAAGVRGRRVLLVDDIATSGATLDACRRALLDGGARDVSALVVASAEATS
jgi:ComF family protein